jgi:hypothetical protein
MNASTTYPLSREEEFAKLVLEDKGAVVTPIPRRSNQTPGFDVRFAGAHYIVEVALLAVRRPLEIRSTGQ